MSDDEYLKHDFEYMLDGWRTMQAEILRLRAENEKLRAALKPFADTAGFISCRRSNDDLVVCYIGDLRAAAAALKETGDE